MHDVKLVQDVGRTFTNVQHLVSGATFDVQGRTATASVRGTKFEVYILPDGAMTVKVWVGTVILHNSSGSVSIGPNQQATVSATGTIGPVGPIVLNDGDPFGPGVDASTAVESGTTPGTEQDYVGAPLTDGQSQTYTYSYAGGSNVKASLGYAGSLMKLTFKGPDGSVQSKADKPPITLEFKNAPGGIYTAIVTGISKLGSGEEPYVAFASSEDCKSADTEVLGAVHRGFTSADLVKAVHDSGSVASITNLSLTLGPDSTSGAILDGSGTFNGVGWSGSVVVAARSGAIAVTPTQGSVFGMPVPVQQLVQQIAQTIGQDPSHINPGFTVDRLFTCSGVLMVDGHMA